MLNQLQILKGKIQMIDELKLDNMTIDQQEQLLNTHQRLIDEYNELRNEIRKDYIL